MDEAMRDALRQLEQWPERCCDLAVCCYGWVDGEALSTERLRSYFDVLRLADALSFALDYQGPSHRLNHDDRFRPDTLTYVEGCLGMAAAAVSHMQASVAPLEDSASHRPGRGHPQRRLAYGDRLDHTIGEDPYAEEVGLHTLGCVRDSVAQGKDRDYQVSQVDTHSWTVEESGLWR